MRKTKLLIFDFDGTLLDTAPGIYKAINQVAAEVGAPPFPFELVKQLIGYGLNHLLQNLDLESKAILNNLPDLRKRFLEVYSETSVQESTLFPGVVEFLSQSPHLLAIVSNKEQLSLRHLVQNSELCNISWVQVSGADTFAEKKPHPMPLLRTMELAGVTPEEAIMIGDGLPDALAAREANVPFIGVNFGYAKESDLRQLGAKHIISSYKDLAKAIDTVDQCL